MPNFRLFTFVFFTFSSSVVFADHTSYANYRYTRGAFNQARVPTTNELKLLSQKKFRCVSTVHNRRADSFTDPYEYTTQIDAQDTITQFSVLEIETSVRPKTIVTVSRVRKVLSNYPTVQSAVYTSENSLIQSGHPASETGRSYIRINELGHVLIEWASSTGVHMRLLSENDRSVGAQAYRFCEQFE